MLIAEKKKRTKTWLHHFIHYRLNNKWSAWSWMTDSVGCFLYSKPWREQRKDALSFFSKVMKIHRLKKMKQWRAMIGYLLKINGIYKNTCKCLGDLVLYLLYWKKKNNNLLHIETILYLDSFSHARCLRYARNIFLFKLIILIVY